MPIPRYKSLGRNPCKLLLPLPRPPPRRGGTPPPPPPGLRGRHLPESKHRLQPPLDLRSYLSS
uniref:Uncharacterized protein n=1 Tax=Leersia perrieri TaxID=77586 RepID=A0A0D9WMW6_9ORYZ